MNRFEYVYLNIDIYTRNEIYMYISVCLYLAYY